MLKCSKKKKKGKSVCEKINVFTKFFLSEIKKKIQYIDFNKEPRHIVMVI